jgi:hypothetical protein
MLDRFVGAAKRRPVVDAMLKRKAVIAQGFAFERRSTFAPACMAGRRRSEPTVSVSLCLCGK